MHSRPRGPPLELFQEPDVVLVKKSDIVDIILEHRDPFHTHAESETCPLLRVHLAVLQNVRMDHPAAHDLHPTRLLADAASLALAEDAGDVDLGAGLGEGKEAG